MANDTMVQVKDSAAWTLGRVCERCPAAILNDRYLLPLLNALVLSLDGEARVAVNTCWVSGRGRALVVSGWGGPDCTMHTLYLTPPTLSA